MAQRNAGLRHAECLAERGADGVIGAPILGRGRDGDAQPGAIGCAFTRNATPSGAAAQALKNTTR